MSQAVTESVAILRNRLSELDTEREQIVAALRALDGVAGNRASASASGKRRQAGRRTAAVSAAKPASSRARPDTARARRSGAGTQAERFLKLVSDKPGITVAQAADKMGMRRPNALYSVASRLAKEGKVTKQGSGYHAA